MTLIEDPLATPLATPFTDLRNNPPPSPSSRAPRSCATLNQVTAGRSGARAPRAPLQKSECNRTNTATSIVIINQQCRVLCLCRVWAVASRARAVPVPRPGAPVGVGVAPPAGGPCEGVSAAVRRGVSREVTRVAKKGRNSNSIKRVISLDCALYYTSTSGQLLYFLPSALMAERTSCSILTIGPAATSSGSTTSNMRNMHCSMASSSLYARRLNRWFT
jgi:hypothetical protein